MNKSALRKELIIQRNSLTPTEISDSYNIIFEYFIKTISFLKPSFFEGKKIAFYSPINNEADFNLFFQFFLKKKAHLYFPVISNNHENKMIFIENTKMETENWTKNLYGILEPQINPSHSENTIPFNLMFLPTVAVHSDGTRLGMGKGYYDRYLSQNESSLKNCLKITCVYDFQIRDDLEPDPWDQKTDWILSEKRNLPLEGFSLWKEKNQSL